MVKKMRIAFYTLLIIVLFVSCKDHDYATIETEFGKMEIHLLNSAPLHKANFKKLANEGFYNDLLFHRVIDGFMIQGGDPQSKGAEASAPLGSGGPGYTIPAEIGTPHFKGMLSAARQGDAVNPKKESSGSQFYIVHGQPVTDHELDAMEKSKGFKYSPAQREKYKKVGGTPMLDGDYTVFGEVVSGQDVIDKIAKVEKDSRDRPLKDVKMKVY
ncbi:MAG: peptidylprolyl isomerase [Saprospiraceae bacterium]|jgi:cyclophilin family peptidyl-prolyl cis-trans isomerase|nr:peptidylprolyl isomerase [Saprospiraceae bacterium]